MSRDDPITPKELADAIRKLRDDGKGHVLQRLADELDPPPQLPSLVGLGGLIKEEFLRKYLPPNAYVGADWSIARRMAAEILMLRERMQKARTDTAASVNTHHLRAIIERLLEGYA